MKFALPPGTRRGFEPEVTPDVWRRRRLRWPDVTEAIVVPARDNVQVQVRHSLLAGDQIEAVWLERGLDRVPYIGDHRDQATILVDGRAAHGSSTWCRAMIRV